jgi:hypothetical protein
MALTYDLYGFYMLLVPSWLCYQVTPPSPFYLASPPRNPYTGGHDACTVTVGAQLLQLLSLLCSLYCYSHLLESCDAARTLRDNGASL